jgi:molybdenum cofactor biosynthesis protein B
MDTVTMDIGPRNPRIRAMTGPTKAERPIPRVLVGAVMAQKSRRTEEMAKIVSEEVRAGGCTLVRSVVVNGAAQFIQQLVSNVANDNEADVVILVGGVGFGPKDSACEALDEFVERQIEGFAQAYRNLLREEMGLGARALLVRATAGVYNKCLVFALTGRAGDIRKAMQVLILPTVSDAVELANGRIRGLDLGV